MTLRMFRALCWKNFHVMLRSPLWLVLIPAALYVLIFCLPLIGSIVEDDVNLDASETNLDSVPANARVLFAPPRSVPRAVMAGVKALLPLADVQERPNEESIRDEWTAGQQMCGVIFTGWRNSTINYTLLSSYPYETDRTLQKMGKKVPRVYENDQLIVIMVALNKAIIETYTGTKVTERTSIEEIVEVNKALKEERTYLITYVFGLVCVAAYPMAKLIALEKDQGVRMLLRLLGARRHHLWLSWLLFALPYDMIVVTWVVVIPTQLRTMHVNSLALGITLSLAVIAGNSLYFLIAASTTNGRTGCRFLCTGHRTAAQRGRAVLPWRPLTCDHEPPLLPTTFDIVFLAVFFLPFGIHMIFVSSAVEIHTWVKLVLCLHPEFGISFGMDEIKIFEATMGMSMWEAAWGSAEEQDRMKLHLMWVWFVLLFDAVLYFLLALYMDPIMPGRYGAARKWTWPCGRRVPGRSRGASLETRRTFGGTSDSEGQSESEEAKIEESPFLDPIVCIRAIRKKYGRRQAVKGLSLDMYKGTVTALLGHNGAGKTTTVSMIAGVTSISAGFVHIGGVDRKEADRYAVSLCPQEDLLLPQLTVKQHLKLAAKLKGIAKDEKEESVQSALKALDLENAQHKRPKQLSGGMKRRTSLAMAVTGHCQLLILDEPTAGTDPEVRHDIWELISRMRQDRTILLTTHLMEEADSLADRVAIMADGRLVCYGSPGFLRREYGAGYLLRVHTRPGAPRAPLQAAVLAAAPGAELREDSPHQLVFAAPPTDAAALGRACADLERRRSELGVEGVGVAASGLEEIYLRAMHFKESEAVDRLRESEAGQRAERAVGWERFFLQLRATFRKELLYMLRVWPLLLLLALVSILIVSLTGILLLYVSEEPLPPLPLRADIYPEPIPYQAGPGGEEIGKRLQAAAERGGRSAYYVKTLKPELKSKLGRSQVAMAVNISADGAELVALYRVKTLHALPIALSLVGNALFKHKAGSDRYNIEATLQPFIGNREERQGEGMARGMWQLILRGALVAWVATLAYPHLQERQSGFKRLQLAAGTPVATYWVVRLLCHTAVSVALAAVLVAVLQLVNKPFEVIGGAHNAGCLMLLFGLFAWGCLPMFYLLGNTSRSAYILSVMSCMLVDLIVMRIAQESEGDEGTYFRYCLSFLPSSCLYDGLMLFWRTNVANHRCRLVTRHMRAHACALEDDNPCCKCPEGEDCVPQIPLYSRSMLAVFAYLTVDCFIYSGLVLLVDWAMPRRPPRTPPREPGEVEEDDDVVEEREYIARATEALGEEQALEGRRPRSSLADGNMLLAEELTKTYGRRCRRRRKRALRGVSLSVRAGECFGLLGLNGAGKTTALRILLADVAPSAGDAVCRRHSLGGCRHKFLRQLGYCPQTDPLVPNLTGREQARLIAQLRGLRPADARAEVELWLDVAELKLAANRRCAAMSGGSKRKLSAVMALAGRPPLPLLDEPSAGVDPAARRNMAAALLAGRAAGRGLLFTSHSMAECESVCDRVAILRAGRAVCVGPLPHLKHKFRRGCWLSVQLATHERMRRRAVAQAVLAELGDKCLLRSKLPMMLKFELQLQDLSWAAVFASMEQLSAANADIASYTVSETTLEDIFLSFREDREEEPHIRRDEEGKTDTDEEEEDKDKEEEVAEV